MFVLHDGARIVDFSTLTAALSHTPLHDPHAYVAIKAPRVDGNPRTLHVAWWCWRARRWIECRPDAAIGGAR